MSPSAQIPRASRCSRTAQPPALHFLAQLQSYTVQQTVLLSAGEAERPVPTAAATICTLTLLRLLRDAAAGDADGSPADRAAAAGSGAPAGRRAMAASSRVRPQSSVAGDQ